MTPKSLTGVYEHMARREARDAQVQKDVAYAPLGSALAAILVLVPVFVIIAVLAH
jgi:hypothetical protein